MDEERDDSMPVDWEVLAVVGEPPPPECSICGDEGVVQMCCGRPRRGWGCSGECVLEAPCVCTVVFGHDGG